MWQATARTRAAARAVRTAAQARPFATDIVFAVVMGALGVVGHLTASVEASERDAGPVGVAILVAQAAAFAYRRRSPLMAASVVTLFEIIFWVSDFATNFDAIAVLAIYAATAHGVDRRRTWQVVGGIVVATTIVAIIGVLVPEEDLPALAVVGLGILNLSAAGLGEMMFARRRRIAELEERAIRAERERELLAAQAVLDERSRIARDMHDVVAHSMSVMVVQAAAAERLVDADPERAADALRNVQETGRESLSEMRRMLGVLRSDDESPAMTPQPTMADVESLIATCNEAGVETELVVTGTPQRRSAGPEMAGYRIVQEALTNVVKHAGRPVRASVEIDYRDDGVVLAVVDDGLGAAASLNGDGMGHGLVGMRERVELYNGTLRAGPQSGGGFAVHATFPYDDAAARA
ncbi:MAG: sensor histidine kinase [Ilumatobacter sp.]|uniref:sensor histidine kinase n=1 Tax=Ilumatobacter sp. TaxID=1967498 RepID=UPI00260EF8BA|nr:sensor histidine kinase [Ilumatobacter sp.]MDJ0767899.1 sensor histidine kinase [Ilumatobacter sp.]